MRSFVASVFVAALIVCCPSWAANITSSPSTAGKTVVVLQGDISDGDTETLKQIIKSSNDAGHLVSGIRLNSNGGSLAEGVKLANIVRYGKIMTVVQNGATCASACFVVFAAGSEKFANYTAQIGVHGASDTAGKESGDATVVMARVVKELGVPPSIIGKMVVTPPSEIIWLSPDDLKAMGVTMAGKPSQTPPDKMQIPAQPLQIPPAVQAKTEPTWENFVEMASSRSREQNGGKPDVFRVCQPELKSCATGIVFKNNKGLKTLVRRTEDAGGRTIARDFCEFNDFGDIRTCFDWDKGSKSVQMKNAQGQWIEVDNN
jgi:hypothetical protein